MDDTGNTTSHSHTPSDPPASPSGSETALSLPSQKPKLVVLHPPTSSEPSTAAADTLQGGPMPLLKVAKTATNDVTNAAGEGGKKGEEIPKLKIASLARPLAGSSIKPSTSTSSIPIKLTVVAPPPAGTSHPVSSVGAETAARNDASGNPPGGREGGRGQSAAIYPLASEASMPPPGRPAKEEMRENVKAEEVEEEDDPDVMDAEEGEGLEDAEMAQAVAGEEPVLLQEEGAVEAYAEARSEQQKQLEELKLKRTSIEEQAAATGADKSLRKLEYLMAQSEMFAHFLGAQAFNKKTGKGGSGAGSKKGSVKMSMEEKDEDAALMKTATSTTRVTRLLAQPKAIVSGIMRPYQLEGLNWMIKLHDNGINGILADEMGLGKTLQTISLLAYLRESRNMHGPHLVIVPKSTVGNWMREFAKWCPEIKTVKLLGSKEERADMVREYLHSKGARRPFNVIVTSYEGVLKERSALEKIQWRYVIIDEAHRIKNEKSALSRMVRMFRSTFRLLITGTPLQNDLHELWALLNYIMPDVFDSSDTFDEWFSIGKHSGAGGTGEGVMSGEGGNENVIRKLHQVLKPFMLRRVKGEVEKDLPPKKETKLYIGMTDMQRDWYRKILRRDGAQLNMLGGTDRLRLLNILMQLRKVCNHPYLFEGAEPGPPYIDGPHIWEHCGKMILLDKLLPRLKAQGSRVLIFCQMTRQLDILEDYLRLKGHLYCRIDGSTKGEDRDNAVERFNQPNSAQFCFLLSTRAGGLGINLATADTVILYDSDWNPQVDLQAMDRAHRIGQTKQVRVFRFITEGTVEEKIVERADRKLFLDAAVIQQGRLAEKHNSVSKDELLHMVKFGADEILNAAGKGFTDEDIDLILRKGEAKTEEQTAKYQQNVQHNLAKFTLLDDTEERNLFEFEGKDYSNKRKDGLVFDMGQRERRPTMNYDVDSYYRSAMKGGTGARGDKEGSTKRPRRLVLPEHQFFNRPRLQQLHEKEQALALKRQARWAFIKELRAGRKAAVAQLAAGEAPEDVARDLEEELNDGRFDLPAEEQEERKALMEEGFKNWSRKDLRALVTSIERFGRADRASILRETAAETGKDESEVTAYYDTFTARMKELPNWQALQDRIRRGEARIARNKQIKEALERKVAGHKNPLQTLTLNYQGGIGKQQQGRLWTDEEDIFLLILMHKFEYGNWERIRMEIRKSEKFCFDWFFKSRSPQELNKRGDTLIKLIEREYGEAEGGSGRKSYSSQRRNKRKREEEGEAAGEDEEDEDEMEIEDDEMEDEGEEDYGQDEESLASGVVSESTQKSTRSKEGSGMHKKKWSY